MSQEFGIHSNVEPISHPSEAEMIVFDIDEVLVMTSMSAVTQGLYMMRQENGFHNPTDHLRVLEANRRSGNPRIIIPDILGLDPQEWNNNEERLMQAHRDIFEKFACLLMPYDGAPELIRDSAQKKITTAFTSRNRYMISPQFCQDIITPEKPNGDFHSIVTVDDVVHPKPYPEGLFRLASAFNIAPSRCVMIGDMWSDIVAARQAGAMGIGIVHNANDRDARTKLYDYGAQHVVSSFDELRDLLEIPHSNHEVL